MTMVLGPTELLDDLVAAGNRACPACGGSLRRWGRARLRHVRGLEADGGLRPARVRCASCAVTQVVLPADVLVRRRDAAVVVGQAWRRSVGGAGARRVARALGLPMETVRGWLRRLRALAAARHGQGGGEPLALELAAWDQAARHAGCADERAIWRFAAHATQGTLLRNTT